MTVKEIFELRRQGKIEEAYDAIRPLYAAHKGRYTSLCMFWTAADIFKKRIDEGRTDEAAKIYEALKRVLPYIKDSDSRPDGQPQPATKPQIDDGIPGLGIDKEPHRSSDSAAAFIQSAARRLTVARQLDKQQAAPKRKQEELSNNSQNSPLKEAQEEAQAEVAQAKKLRSSEADFRDYRNFATFRNPKEEAISAVSALSASPKEDPSASEEASNSPSKAEQEDLSGHLAVSLDEGIIRPIEGLNAVQRVVLACVVGHPGYSVPRISESTGIPQKSIERHVAVLIDRGLIEHREKDPNPAEYYPTDSIS